MPLGQHRLGKQVMTRGDELALEWLGGRAAKYGSSFCRRTKLRQIKSEMYALGQADVCLGA
jgi:hypothetical protein